MSSWRPSTLLYGGYQLHTGRDQRPDFDTQRRFELDRNATGEAEPERLGSDPVVVSTRGPKHCYHECARAADAESHYAIHFGSDP